jgi:hypothetical protein
MSGHPRHFDAEMANLLAREANRLGETVEVYVSRAVALRLVKDLERRDDPQREDYRSAFIREGLMPVSTAPAEDSPIYDPARLETLADTGILDTSPSQYFDRIVSLAAEALGVPAAAIAIVERDRQIYWSSVGMNNVSVHSSEVPLERSVAQQIVATGQPLIVDDARADAALRSHPVVQEGAIAAYLGLPLTSPTGHTIGALSVADVKPHRWSRAHIEILEDLADRVRDRIFAAEW